MATAEGEEKKAGRRTSRRPRPLPGAQRDSERPAPGGSLEGGLLPELLRRGLSLGFTGFFMTEEAVRRALGESVPREWLEFFVAQSDRTRAELVERLSREFGRVFSAIEPVEILRRLLDGQTLEIQAKIRLQSGARDGERRSGADRGPGTEPGDDA